VAWRGRAWLGMAWITKCGVSGVTNTMLTGMKQICAFVGRNKQTVEDWIRTRAFPAKKVNGIWGSDTEMIQAWWRRQLAETERRGRGETGEGGG